MSSKLTRAEADILVKSKKVVSASATWKSIGGAWRLETAVLEPKSDSILRLTGYIGTNYSFSLLYRNYPIRMFTKHHKHMFQGEVYRVPHKHIWSEITETAEVYIPNDINPKDNINDQFLDFCKECNIDLKGGYQRVVYEFRR